MLAFLFLQQALSMYLLRQLDTTVISGTSEFDRKRYSTTLACKNPFKRPDVYAAVMLLI